MSPYYLERKIQRTGTRNGPLYKVISIHKDRQEAARMLRQLATKIVQRPKYRIIFRKFACSECGKFVSHALKLDELGLCIFCANYLRRDYNHAYMKLNNHRGIIMFVPKDK